MLQKKMEVQKQQNRSVVNLPELEIPKFDGNKLKWIEFWNFFKVTVDQNYHLSNIEKFIYLKNCLTGDAKEALSGILVSNDNYQNAKSLLNERFEDSELVKHTHFLELIYLPPAVNNPKDLRAVYDKLEIHLRSLESLQQDTNHDAKEKWVTSTLRNSLNNYICATEWIEQMAHSEKSEKFTQRHRNGTNHFFIQCKFCKGSHWSDQCVEYPTAEDRRQKIKDSCFLCLKKGHIAYKCQLNKVCFYCGRKNHHNRSLCPQKFVSKMVNEATKPITDEPEICQLIKNENWLKDSGVKQEQNQMTGINNETFRCTKNVQLNEKEQTAEMTQGFKDQSNKCTNMVSEDECDRKHGVMENSHNQLIKEKAELQAINTELSDRLLDVKEKLSKLQLENKDLETQLMDIANSLTNKPKESEEAMCSEGVTSTCNFEFVKVQTDKKKMEKNELTKEEHQLMRSKLGDGTGFEECTESKMDFTTCKHKRFSVFMKGNIHQHWHMDKISWPWECRGNPTILL